MKNLIFKLKLLEKVIILKPKQVKHFSFRIKINYKYRECKTIHNLYFSTTVFLFNL